MTNTQHEALMAELREMRVALDRFCARVDSMLGPQRAPYVVEPTGTEEAEARTLLAAAGVEVPAPRVYQPAAQVGTAPRKRGRK